MHEWFMHFGGIAFALAIAGFFVTRLLVNRHPSRNSDDRQGAAWGTIALGAIGALVLVIALVQVLLGFAGTVMGWIGFALIGMAVGISKNTD